MTGLANRKVFSERSERATLEYHGASGRYGLILIDADDFKRINDRFGHDTGDDVLRVLGRVLNEQPRGVQDIAARLGGEEFAVLCFGAMTESSIRQMAERIRAQINAESIPTSLGPLKFTCSFGTSLGSASDTNWRCIYARADSALYEAKAAGKNCVSYRPAPQDQDLATG